MSDGAVLKYRYGAVKASCPAKLELEAIKRCLDQGDYWKDVTGEVVGLTLAEHTRKFAKLAWPHYEWQRWNLMMLEEICKGGTIAIFGPASSGKTSLATVVLLSFYWAAPDEFTGLCSTTDLMRLELRVFGEVKLRYKEARERYPWLAGHLIDSRQRIATDAKELEGRDFRNGVLGIATKRGGEFQGLADFSGLKNRYVVLVADECFPAGQRVDTANGARPIESIRSGDIVQSALGPSRVIAVSRREVTKLLVIKSKDSRCVTCTENHPFLTQKGWIKACQLNQSHYMLSAYEALSILQSTVRANYKQSSLLCRLSRQGVSLSAMRETLQKEVSRPTTKVLHPVLCESMYAVGPGISNEVLLKGAGGKDWSVQGHHAQGTSRNTRGSQSPHDREESDEESYDAKKAKRYPQADGLEAACARRQWNGTDRSRISIAGCFSASDQQLCCPDKQTNRQQLSDMLQTGRGFSETETRNRSRWQQPLLSRETSARREENPVAHGAWVDCVTVQEQADNRGNASSDRGTTVYNLQVEGHPSYSVNGFLVHNCHLMEPGFLQGANNLKANNNAGKFIAIYLGNLVDLETPLGEAAEPECGWDALPDSAVSRTYKTKFFNGRAVQLIGRDSPNFDFPKGAEPYRYLIGRNFIEELKHDCGEGSPIYIAQAGGTIPRSSLANRVVTKEVCRKFNAFEPVVWGAEKLTRLYGMDVSYTTEHGDRTCGAPMAFGRDIEGKMRLAFLERTKVYALSNAQGDTVEEKIAWMVKEELARFDIPVGHFFYDGTGRSSFTAAAMRIIGTGIQPVEFGGRASERPNFIGRKHREGPDKGELMLCHQVFDRFVTELWFATRYLIEADQCRALPEDTAKDGYMRLWTLVAGNKMSVETKRDMKKRVNRSPDFYDTFATSVEGARRLGFVIGTEAKRNAKGTSWLAAVKKDYRQELSKGELTYA